MSRELLIENYNTLPKIVSLITTEMANLLPSMGNELEHLLVQAMRYSALAPAKRIRGALVIAAASLFDVPLKCSLNAAVAVEYIHTYSLIHDDLPAMDNDDYRRGQLSCHKKYGEAIAILAGDALLTYAFQVLASNATHSDPSIRAYTISVLTVAIGYNGMASGQLLDIASDRHLDIESIMCIHKLKTAALFAAACEIGAVLGTAHSSLQEALRNYGSKLGLAFQIIDDILDHLRSKRNEMAEGSNIQYDKNNIISIIGRKKAIIMAKDLITQSITYLNAFDTKAFLLKDIAKYCITTIDHPDKKSVTHS